MDKNKPVIIKDIGYAKVSTKRYNGSAEYWEYLDEFDTFDKAVEYADKLKKEKPNCKYRVHAEETITKTLIF